MSTCKKEICNSGSEVVKCRTESYFSLVSNKISIKKEISNFGSDVDESGTKSFFSLLFNKHFVMWINNAKCQILIRSKFKSLKNEDLIVLRKVFKI
jgi:hypothetical protein